MNYLKHIKNIVTGTYAHWNKISNSVFLELRDRIKMYDSSVAIIFDAALISCYSIIDSTIGPNPNNKELIFKLNLKNYTKKQFHEIYNILFITLISLIILNYPDLKKNLEIQSSDLLNKDITRSKLYSKVLNLGLKNTDSISFLTLDSVIEELGINKSEKIDKLHFAHSYLFSITFLTNVGLMYSKLNQSICEFNRNN